MILQDGRSTIVKITGPIELLKRHAERLEISMRLKDDVKGNMKVGYEKFSAAHEDRYVRKGGRIFSSLERQRILNRVLEGPDEVGCAELNLDELISKKIFSHHFPLHIESEVLGLYEKWIKIVPWPLKLDGQRRRMLPDLGLLQQPIRGARDYFGEKIAFYFAWMEHYTLWLLVLMWIGVIDAIIDSASDPNSEAVVYSIV